MASENTTEPVTVHSSNHRTYLREQSSGQIRGLPVLHARKIIHRVGSGSKICASEGNVSVDDRRRLLLTVVGLSVILLYFGGHSSGPLPGYILPTKTGVLPNLSLRGQMVRLPGCGALLLVGFILFRAVKMGHVTKNIGKFRAAFRVPLDWMGLKLPADPTLRKALGVNAMYLLLYAAGLSLIRVLNWETDMSIW